MVSEIRDKATRRRLAVLPYELRFREPLPEYVRLGECLSRRRWRAGLASPAAVMTAPGPAASAASWVVTRVLIPEVAADIQ